MKYTIYSQTDDAGQCQATFEVTLAVLLDEAETRCGSCGGVGETYHCLETDVTRSCGTCGGSGEVLTEAGEALLKFLGRHGVTVADAEVDGQDEDSEREHWIHPVGDITLTTPGNPLAVTMHNAEWSEALIDLGGTETCWQLGGWIRKPSAHAWEWAVDWALVTVTYPDGDSEVAELRGLTRGGTAYGDGRGHYTKFVSATAPKRIGGDR